MFIKTWYIPDVDLSTFRFGIMFRIVDLYIRIRDVGGIYLFPLLCICDAHGLCVMKYTLLGPCLSKR